MICGTIDSRPIKKEATANRAKFGAKKAANKDSADNPAMRMINLGRSTTSPNGTKNNNPNA